MTSTKNIKILAYLVLIQRVFICRKTSSKTFKQPKYSKFLLKDVNLLNLVLLILIKSGLCYLIVQVNC